MQHSSHMFGDIRQHSFNFILLTHRQNLLGRGSICRPTRTVSTISEEDLWERQIGNCPFWYILLILCCIPACPRLSEDPGDSLPRWLGGLSTPSWAVSTNTPPAWERYGSQSFSSFALRFWSWLPRASGETSSPTSRATRSSPAARTSAMTTSSPCHTSVCGACSSSLCPRRPCWWPCMSPTGNVGTRGRCWPPTAQRRRRIPSWRRWRRGACQSQARCGGRTPAACSSGSSLRGVSCTHSISFTMASRCPDWWSASSGLAPTRWTASSPDQRRRPSSPSSWWRHRPSAWCLTWLSWAISFARPSWGARAGTTRGNPPTATKTAWRGTMPSGRTRRMKCCCHLPQIHPEKRQYVEGRPAWSKVVFRSVVRLANRSWDYENTI